MDTTDKACVLFLDIPPKSLAGIDLISFTTTPQFKGIKALPRGWHFIFCSSSDSLSIRHGAWFQVTAQNNLTAFTWDSEAEKLIPIIDDVRLMQFRANLGQIWKDSLAPYRQSSGRNGDVDDEEKLRDLTLLTDCITPALLDRILGEGPEKWGLTSASSAKVDADDIPNLHVAGSAMSGQQEETELHFLPIDLKRTWREGATGRERTDAARDHSWYLSSLIDEYCAEGNENEVVGEVQFCFLMVLVLSNFSCLEQWKRILSLVFTSFEGVEQRPALFARMIRILALQMRHVGDAEGGTGLFDMGETDSKFLKGLLRKLKLGLKDLESGIGKQDVLLELDELENFLKSEFGWEDEEGYVMRHGMVQLEDGEMVHVDVDSKERDEEDEEGEYAPTVVELTEEQLRSLGGGSAAVEPEELEEDRILEDGE